MTTDIESAKRLESFLSGGNHEWVVEISKPKKHRTTKANAFLWALCKGIADAIQSTKEEIYKDLVRRKGIFDYIVLRPDAGERFKAQWASRGIGWFTEEVECGIDNAVQFLAYYGTSVYTTTEMASVIDEAVLEARGLGVPFAEDQLMELRESWREDI